MLDESSSSAGVCAIVLSGGDPPLAAIKPRLPTDALVIAADSGLDHARRLGLRVDVVVGDLDSVDRQVLDVAKKTGTVVEAHPVEKDETDLELAIATAHARGAHHVTVVGGYGGRLDHFLANLTLLASPRFRALHIDAWVGHAYLTVIHERAELHGPLHSLCSLLALGGTAHGVTTEGLRYPLRDDDLLPGSTRGVSNELIAPVATLSLRTGVLLAIQPNLLDDRLDNQLDDQASEAP
jgi:thiamine pyrophosphokinase